MMSGPFLMLFFRVWTQASCGLAMVLGAMGVWMHSPLHAGSRPDHWAATVQDRAHQIDAFIEEKLVEKGLEPSPQAPTSVLLRRVYLDLIGRIPTVEEITRFEHQPVERRWEQTIDQLLQSRGHVSHEFNYWADLLRIQSRMRNLPGAPYISWVKRALEENMPYDQFVAHLINAEGYLWEDGATGFYFRDAGMELDHMANTFQVFLGTQVVCAQCHDHPYDAWTQKQYYQQAAYAYGVKTSNPKAGRQLRALGNNQNRKDIDPELKAVARRMTRPLRYRVEERKTSLKLPEDYAYDDAKPKSVVEPKVLFADQAQTSDHSSLRHQYADWITSPENPRFASVIANRYWKRMMGVGLLEPVDDLGDQSQASHPELLRFLTDTLIELKFDLQAYQAILARTQTYRRATLLHPHSSEETFLFQGRPLTRMRAEQWWDSVMTLIVPDLDERLGAVRVDRNYEMAQQLAGKPLQEMLEVIASESKLEEQIKELQTRVNQLQRKVNGRNRQNKVASPRFEADRKNLAANRKALAELRKQSVMGAQVPARDSDPRWRGLPAQLVRASEVASPAPEGHFLREFGQSDRETIDAFAVDANVPQALMLLNGPLEAYLGHEKAVLASTLETSSDPSTQLELLFRAFLTRSPNAEERAWLLSAQQEDGPAFAKNLTWMLLNAREFAFIQ